ncbi:MAG: hypothetical protein JSU70_13470 [Phycisphaerales bacterium]|nr:MAG: hypothetical protein JSU70_13470 [Phycisphaerales bacterium]
MRYRMSKLWLSLLAVVLLAFASCIPEFKNPLPAPKDTKPDAKLLGTWESTPGKDKSQVSFFSKKSGGMYVVFIGDIDSDGPPEASVWSGYNTNVDKDKFLCLRAIKTTHEGPADEQEERTWFVTHYKISNRGILSISPFSQDAVKRMIERGTLKGEIEQGPYLEKVTVTASSDELSAALVKEGVDSFIDEDLVLKFQRLSKQRILR